MWKSLEKELEKAANVGDRFVKLLGGLNIGFRLFNYNLPIVEELSIPFVLQFQIPQDAKYVAWNILENISDGYLEPKYVERLNKLLEGTKENFLVADCHTMEKIANVLESLIEEGILTEWQCSAKTLEVFNSLYGDYAEKKSWISKFNAIRHIEIWNNETANAMTKGILNILSEHNIPAKIIGKPLDEPFVSKIYIDDACLGVELFKKIRLHDKFKEFPSSCIVSFEQLTCDIPNEDDGLTITLNYSSMSLLYEIIKDL